MFIKKDPFNREIKLKKSTWEYKICNYHNTNNNGECGNSHPEMSNYYNEVENSVEHPHYILQDTKLVCDDYGNEIEIPNEKREEYYRFFFDKEDKLGIIKTIVDFDQKNNGDIVTTHKMNGRIRGVRKGGRIIYDSSKK
jgi:hypothetical protein